MEKTFYTKPLVSLMRYVAQIAFQVPLCFHNEITTLSRNGKNQLTISVDGIISLCSNHRCRFRKLVLPCQSCLVLHLLPPFRLPAHPRSLNHYWHSLFTTLFMLHHTFVIGEIDDNVMLFCSWMRFWFLIHSIGLVLCFCWKWMELMVSDLGFKFDLFLLYPFFFHK